MEIARITFIEPLIARLRARAKRALGVRSRVKGFMQQCWHHPEIRITAVPAPSGQLIRFKPISERNLYPQRRSAVLGIRPFTAFVVFSSVSLVLMLCAMILRGATVSSLSQIADLREGFFSSVIQSASLDSDYPRDFTSPAVFEEDREAAAEVLYIQEVIEEHRGVVNSRDLAISIVAESRRAGVDPFFVAALIKSESSFKKHARSHKGAIGLMQIQPDTGRFISRQANVAWHGGSRLSDPRYNLKLGIAYIQHLFESFDGNLEHALIAYNWGPANLNQALSRRGHIPSSTIKYARSILNNQKRFRRDYDSTKARFAYMDTDFIVG